MNESKKIFRDKLLDMEITNTALKEKYERKVQAMIEKKLTGITKLAHIGGLVMGLGFLILFGTLAIMATKEFPLWGRSIFALGAIFGFVFLAFEAWLLKKGTINLKKDEVAMAGLGWGLITIIGAIAMVFSGKLPDPVVGIRMLAIVIIFEIAAAFGLNKAFMQRSELNMREKLLEIEHRLAEISEKIEKNQGK